MLTRSPFAPSTMVALLTMAASLLGTTAATAETPPPLATVPVPAPKYRNNGMRIAGITLTAVGAAVLASGIAFIALDQSKPVGSNCGHPGPCDGGDGVGVVTWFLGVPLVALSTVFAGVGIPLWVVGAQRPKPELAASPAWAIPSVAAGPRSVSLRWTF
jgi:hypothetical protein